MIYLNRSVPVQRADEPEIDCGAMYLLRRLRLGDSFRLIAVTPACPNSGLLTHQRRYRQCPGGLVDTISSP